MNIQRKMTALLIAGAASVTLVACGGDDAAEETTTAAPGAETTTSEVAALPTAAELNDVLARATDPNLPPEERAKTVENGEQAPEIFDIIIQSQQETGATLEVVDPVVPGLGGPGTVEATVVFTVPDQQPQNINAVEFRDIDGQWRLSQQWACTLVENVAPDRVPPMCAPAPAPVDPNAPAPAPADPNAPAPVDPNA
ncbi:hypothetical protein, partial [Corynebacterium sp.]|uniref:hypothetical protein n=1 Tax=Corynebacterium sp. TaxID=1720 RepID=UPI0026DCA7E5